MFWKHLVKSNVRHTPVSIRNKCLAVILYVTCCSYENQRSSVVQLLCHFKVPLHAFSGAVCVSAAWWVWFQLVKYKLQTSWGHKQCCEPCLYLLMDSSCTQTNSTHTQSLLLSAFLLSSFCICMCVCMFPCLPDPNRSIFGGNSLSDRPESVSLNIMSQKHNFHRSGLFSLCSSDIWTVEQLSV